MIIYKYLNFKIICANGQKENAIFMFKARLETTISLIETVFREPMTLWNKVLH